MRTHYEIIAQDIIPAMRALIAKDLMEKHGLTQIDTANKMGVTQAAVSQYMRNIRGYKIKILEKNEEIINQISNLANKIAAGELNEKTGTQEICNICEFIKEKNIIEG